MSFIADFCDYLITSPLSVYLQQAEPLIPALQTMHILAISVLLSAMGMVSLRLLGWISTDQPVAVVTKRFYPAAWLALIVLLTTGAVLILLEPARSLMNSIFQLKMLMLAVVTGCSLALQRLMKIHASQWTEGICPPKKYRVVAAIAMIIWFGIVFAGRWIAYV
ncbi:MAG: DUF6644 family protein [Steroidobacteraceae bacterium]